MKSTLSLILFIVTGVIWLIWLLPLQRVMIRLSKDCVDKGFISKDYKAVSRKWAVLGTIATVLPFVILCLMVTRGV